jgi:serine/threonine protein phosphatase PrpC
MPGNLFNARTVDIQWKQQEGRSRYQRHSVADGYRGRHPYASVAAVAQSTGQDPHSAEYTVSAVRDTFAEGVAFAPGEALIDALDEARHWISEKGHAGCSVAAAAVLDCRVWFCWIGNCRIYQVSGHSVRLLSSDHSLAETEGLSPGDPGFRQKARETTASLGKGGSRPGEGRTELAEGDSLLLLTPGVWLYIDEDGIHRHISDGSSLAADLTSLLRETRTGHRRQGGAAAGFRLLSSTGSFVRIPGWLGAIAIVLCLVLAGLYLGGVLGPERSAPPQEEPFHVEDSIFTEIVLPLPVVRSADTLAAADTVPPPPSVSLPVRAMVSGGMQLGVSADSVLQFTGGSPDPAWENWTGGVYVVRGDSAITGIAERIAAGQGFDSVTTVDRIVVVRQASASRFSSWLSSLDPADAAGTAVVVETNSSVAAGASWIRNYPVFVNGARDMSALHSCFRGDSLPGIPAIEDDAAYRILVLPPL